MNRMEAKGSNVLRRCKQAGAAVVEFAFVFPILLFLIYGLVVYAYIFVLQESITFVAQQAAASAVSVSPNQTASAQRTQMTTLAQNTVTQSLSWLGAGQLARVSTTVTFCSLTAGTTCPTDGSDAVVVTVRFSMNTPTSLFPVLSFGSGQVPPTPTQLASRATVRI
ncbi:TadE family protein [Stenotrophobium rhamnosiphilum]|nr:TadE family protein [Stenotrophobium rhamnosiphilum]